MNFEARRASSGPFIFGRLLSDSRCGRIAIRVEL
jgi:hypothetical protein